MPLTKSLKRRFDRVGAIEGYFKEEERLMGLTQRSVFVVFGLLGGIVTAAPAAADLVSVQQADFSVHAGVQILNNGVPSSDAHSQNGDQNNNPFTANVAAQTSIPEGVTLASSAFLHASWGASNIGANGSASFNPSGNLSSGIIPSAEVNSNLSITFQVQTDATYEFHGSLVSTIHSFDAQSEISLMNFDTSEILHHYSDQGPPISFSGTLSAGVNYQLNVDASVFFHNTNVLEDLEAGFGFNMELTAVPAPGAFGLFLLSGIIGRPKRRR